MKNILVMSVVAVGALAMSASTASAQWGCGYPPGGYGRGYSAYSPYQVARANLGGLSLSIGGYGSHYAPGYVARSYGYQALRPTWHNTTHLDYHAPSLVPHGSHFHAIPGHYDVHRTGHWDRHGIHH